MLAAHGIQADKPAAIERAVPSWELYLMSSLMRLDDSNFDATAASAGLPLLVVFSADWCVTCRSLMPVIQETAAELGESLRVGVVKVDDSPSTTARFNVKVLPAMLVLKDGIVQKRMFGAKTKGQLRQLLSDVLC